MKGHRRLKTTLVALGCAVALAAVPAGATPAGEDGEHTTTVCHVTNSQKKPWVAVTVDVAAFDGEGKRDHTRHESRDGRIDFELGETGECADGPQDD